MRNLTKINPLIFLLVLAPFLFANYVYSQEENEANSILIANHNPATPDVVVIEKFLERNDKEFVYRSSEDLEIKTETLKKDDILKAIPSISTEDNKTLGLLIPPFAYFAKKF